MNQGGGEI